jgi:hypothetical protein
VEYLGGAAVTTSAINWPGNPNLRPERTVELEGGADISAWRNRVSVELTGYSKTTHDALVNEVLGWDANQYIYQQNIGAVRNTGAEASATIGLLQSRALLWDVTVNVSVNHNKLISFAPGVTAQTFNVSDVTYRQAPGYPLYGIWSQRIRYTDANHDGIIEARELTIAPYNVDSMSFIGSSLPTQEMSVSTHLALGRGTMTLGGLVDYRGGYRIANYMAYDRDYSGNSQATNDPAAPLWLQARGPDGAAGGPYEEDGSFVRIREVSVTYVLPRGITRSLRAQSVGLTAAVRNLALWTRYTGVDPEVTNVGGSANAQYTPTSNTYVVNNDVRSDWGAVPLLRYWVVRLNVGL